MVDKRRSLKIREENDKKIQSMRSKFLFNNIDIDYTTMVNIFIDIGDKVLKSGTYNITDMTDIFKKYLEENIDTNKISQILKDYQIENVTKL